jgi:hypothetical protein
LVAELHFEKISILEVLKNRDFNINDSNYTVESVEEEKVFHRLGLWCGYPFGSRVEKLESLDSSRV